MNEAGRDLTTATPKIQSCGVASNPMKQVQ